MDFDIAAKRLKGIPHTNPDKGKELYDWVLRQQPGNILELGFYHGVSTCYMAAALDELGSGHITTIDRENAKDHDPTIDDLLGDLGLASYVTTVHVERSFTWWFHDVLDGGDPPMFDFVFQDGGHTWDTAGYTFFLCDRVLRPGGWLLFDDMTWTLAHKGRMKDYPEAERAVPGVGEAFRLLVEPHPGYTQHSRTRGGKFGWARKRLAVG